VENFGVTIVAVNEKLEGKALCVGVERSEKLRSERLVVRRHRVDGCSAGGVH
jgi:hypothetical protein